MAKKVPDSVKNDMLDIIADSATRIDLCSTEPSTYAEATSTYSLASITITAGAGNGDITIADGDTSGRKITFIAQSSVAVDTTGTGTHIAVTNGSDTLLLVSTTSSVDVDSDGVVDISAFSYELRDVE